MVFENILNPIFFPLLSLPTLWAVIILSFLISLIITIIYKYTTDQNLMKQLKEEMKEFQKEVKELKKEPEKAMQVQKKAMQTNMKYMMQSMKSTLFTFIPIIIIFSWMTANLAYEPIMPGQDFTVSAMFAKGANGKISLSGPDGLKIEGSAEKNIEDGEVKWILNGKEGEYLLVFDFNEEKHEKEILITQKQAYKPAVKKIKNSSLKLIQVGNNPKKLLNLFGWKVGWLGTYIIFSIIFSMLLRKVIKVY